MLGVIIGLASVVDLSATGAWILVWLAGVNLAVAVLYGYDKGAARSGWLRVPENVLHFYTLAGGTPAALASQRLFRHKTIKSRFRRMFWLVVLGQVMVIGGIVWLRYR